jgi:DNA-binding response OmpR family regulator
MTKLLIVEDDPSTQELLQFIAQGAGYEVCVAGDGKEGLDSARSFLPAVVILDVMLPEIHGYEVCHRIKTDAALKHTKVIMLSAKAFPADRKQALEAGADLYLTKPIQPKDFLDNIQNILNQK